MMGTVIPGHRASDEPGISSGNLEIPGSRFARPGMTGVLPECAKTK
jgi:hypothetical protein